MSGNLKRLLSTNGHAIGLVCCSSFVNAYEAAACLTCHLYSMWFKVCLSLGNQ